MTTRADLVAEARTWVGTRYHHQGRLKGVGVDCIGLIGGVALACALPGAREWAEDAPLHAYARRPDATLLMASCSRFMDRVPNATDIQPADVLVFAIEGEPRHFALVSALRPTRVIHAYALLSARRVVEQSLPIAKAQMLAAFRFRGVMA